jgi:hypothetical protein
MKNLFEQTNVNNPDPASRLSPLKQCLNASLSVISERARVLTKPYICFVYMRKKDLLLTILVAVSGIFWTACSESNAYSSKTKEPAIDTSKKKTEFIHHDTDLSINGRSVSVLYPAGTIKGMILCLPGWNFSRTDVCEHSTFCAEAKKMGYALILPEMGKSVYATAVFPETRKDWLKYPQLHFITDTLIPFVQQHFDMMKYGQNNFVYGISTGGRGVAMVALHTDSLFRGGISLSGDFDQTLDLRDNLMRGYYGEYDQFKERWELDNPGKHASSIQIPLFIGHGNADKVVPVEQSLKFGSAILLLRAKQGNELHIGEKGEHNYEFWGSETPNVLKFIRKFSK